MPAYKDTNGTYFVSFYYEDFRGVKKRKMKRGFARRRDAPGLGTPLSAAKHRRPEHEVFGLR